MAGKIQGNLGGRGLQNCVGLPYHSPIHHQETPFILVYGLDAMIPVEIQESSPRFPNFVAGESNEERRVNLDLLDKVREEARIKVEALKRKVEYKHKSKLKPRQF